MQSSSKSSRFLHRAHIAHCYRRSLDANAPLTTSAGLQVRRSAIWARDSSRTSTPGRRSNQRLDLCPAAGAHFIATKNSAPRPSPYPAATRSWNVQVLACKLRMRDTRDFRNCPPDNGGLFFCRSRQQELAQIDGVPHGRRSAVALCCRTPSRLRRQPVSNAPRVGSSSTFVGGPLSALSRFAFASSDCDLPSLCEPCCATKKRAPTLRLKPARCPAGGLLF